MNTLHPKEHGMSETQTLRTGLAIGESPRWHDDRLWLANWGTGEIVAVDLTGKSEVMARVPATLPYSLDWLPDGRLLVISGRERLLLHEAPDGSLATYADLSAFGEVFNELVVDSRGNAYVNGGVFDPTAGTGNIVLVTPDGSAREVADDIAFGNGMAVTPDGSTLIVAESFARRLTAFTIAPDGGLHDRRVWADLGSGVPDGICLDADGAVWYADVPNHQCVRVAPGGQILHTVPVDQGAFACMLGGPDGRTLFILTAEWHGMDGIDPAARTGQVRTTQAPAPRAGRP
jgi:sugar lactone lactonase YvrE